jgi:hypothetical protein
MAPLSSAVTATLFAESIKADPAACRLLHGKKQLDLTTPWRFANLPSGAKLQLLTGGDVFFAAIQIILWHRQIHAHDQAIAPASSCQVAAESEHARFLMRNCMQYTHLITAVWAKQPNC